jgi:hypothetical protein
MSTPGVAHMSMKALGLVATDRSGQLHYGCRAHDILDG